MSGHRWSSLSCICMALLFAGCQSDSASRLAWNPFSKKPDASVASRAEASSFSLPKFARRKTDESQSPEAADPLPVAEEQVERLLEQGQLALQNNRLDEARKAYSEVLNSSPDNATAHHGMAMAADLSEQWADAEYHYRQALRIRPRDANLLCDLGYSYLLQNRYSEASRYLNHAVDTNPDHESAQMNLALLDLKQGKRSAAEQRITARFGANGNAAQILAQLESQVGAAKASFQQDAQNVIPANATFEQVQELARQERLEAERRRAAAGIPPAHQSPSASDRQQSVSVLSNQAIAAQNPGWDSRGVAPINSNPLVQQAQNAPLLSGAPTASHYPAAAQEPQPWTGSPAENGASLTAATTSQNYVVPPGVHSPAPAPGSQQGSSQSPVMTAQNLPNSSAAIPGSPLPANPTMSGPASPFHMPVGTSPGFHPAVSAGVQPSGVAQNPAFPNIPGPIVQVHSSGAFQPAASGSVSYGQPLGFSSPPGASSPTNNFPSSPQQSAMVTQNPAIPAMHQEPNALAQERKANPPVYLDGLNAGPGAIFPVSQSTNPQLTQGQPGMNSGPNEAAGNLRMGNISSPGSNSLINGTMYGQPQSALPSREWLNQQQMQLQAQQLAKPYQPHAQNSQSLPYSAPAPSAWSPSPAALNPLEAYELQRQKLDNEYNARLQQMDRSHPANTPRFQ